MEIIDTHIHTDFSRDCEYSPEIQIAAAEQKKISIIAFTDHAEMNNFDARTAKRIAEAMRHIPRVIDFHGNCGAPFITHGVELAQAHFNPTLASSIIKAGNYDFVLGSLHSVTYAEKLPYNTDYAWAEPEPGDLYFVDYKNISAEQIFDLVEEYIDVTGLVAETADFDSFAHFGYVTRYIFRSTGERYDLLKHKDKVSNTLSALISRGKSLEVNTADIGKEYDRLVPGINVIQLYYDLGGRYITVGSDAHTPEKIGNGIEYACRALREIGFTEVSYYLRRNRNIAEI